MKKFLSLLIAFVLIVSNFSGIASSVSAETINDSIDSELPESYDQLLSDFFTSEEFVESITQTPDIPKKIFSNSDVVDVIKEESSLVNEVLTNESIVNTIVEDPSLINEVLTNENIVNTIVENPSLVNEVLENESNDNTLEQSEDVVSTITEDTTLVSEVLKNEDVANTIAEDPSLVNEVLANENIVNTIIEEPTLKSEVLTNDSVVQTILEDEKLVDTISSNDNTVDTLLSNEELVDSLLSEPEIAEEIKSDLLTGYNSELEDSLGNNAEKIKPTIQNLDSNGIKLQLDIDTDEYATDLIIDSNLKGNDITVSSVLDVGDKIEKTVYDVKIIENTEEQFKAILIEKNTGEQITISENEAKASIISVVVRIIGGAIKYVSKQSGKQVTKSAAKKAKLSFSSGRAGEKYLETLVKVRSKQEYFRTPLGGRYIDVLDTSGIGHESKVGYVSLTSTIRKQIDKDALLIKKKELKGAKWHFFRSDTTGKVGASKPVLNYLKSKGIPYKIYK